MSVGAKLAALAVGVLLSRAMHAAGIDLGAEAWLLAALNGSANILECCTPTVQPHPFWRPGLAVVRSIPNGETVALLAAVAWGLFAMRLGPPAGQGHGHWTRSWVGFAVILLPVLYLGGLHSWPRLWPALT